MQIRAKRRRAARIIGIQGASTCGARRQEADMADDRYIKIYLEEDKVAKKPDAVAKNGNPLHIYELSIGDVEIGGKVYRDAILTYFDQNFEHEAGEHGMVGFSLDKEYQGGYRVTAKNGQQIDGVPAEVVASAYNKAANVYISVPASWKTEHYGGRCTVRHPGALIVGGAVISHATFDAHPTRYGVSVPAGEDVAVTDDKGNGYTVAAEALKEAVATSRQQYREQRDGRDDPQGGPVKVPVRIPLSDEYVKTAETADGRVKYSAFLPAGTVLTDEKTGEKTTTDGNAHFNFRNLREGCYDSTGPVKVYLTAGTEEKPDYSGSYVTVSQEQLLTVACQQYGYEDPNNGPRLNDKDVPF